MHTILIVEDDADINDLIKEIVSRAGYKAIQAYSGTEARLLLSQERVGLILLDLMLPGITGEALLPVIRAQGDTPVIIISAKGEVESKISALKLGADDYITKPFDNGELVARIEVCLRRVEKAPTPTESNVVTYKEITLDKTARLVEVNGVAVTLTGKEFDILCLLVSNPKKVFTKANIFSSVWNDEFFGDDNTVNVHISKLRSKLGGDCIQTVWGIGFKMME